jgi:hypothetical protein
MVNSKRAPSRLPVCICHLFAAVVLQCGFAAFAQDLPDAPREASTPPPASSFTSRYINDPAPIVPVALDAGGKLDVYLHRTMSPATVLGPAAEAAFIMALPPKGYPAEWRQGDAAYWRNYAAALGRQQTGEFSRMVVGIALHEDPRYYRSASAAFIPRVLHAVGFTLIDRSDSGNLRPALANIIGAGAGGFVGNAFLPAGYTDLRHAGVRTGIQMSSFAASNILDEFRPELQRLKNSLTDRLHRN